MLAPYASTLLISTLGCLALIPLVIRVATRYGILDVPNEERRVHRHPVPRLGGIAIFLSAIVGASAWYLWQPAGATAGPPLGAIFPGFVVGVTIIFLTGLVDDLRGVRARTKLIAQTLAAAAVLYAGLRIDGLSIAPGAVALPIPELIGLALLTLWIVGITNAFNLIDGIDGLAGHFALIGLLACITTDLVLHGQRPLALSVALIGAVVAFLHFNRNPARIFLGDSGSMVLGFYLAVRLVVAATDEQGTLYALVPLTALAFPIADTAVAIARRWLRGHPFSRADGRHIHHQLLALGFPVRRTVETLSVIFAGVAALGIAITFAPARLTVAMLLLGAVAVGCVGVYGLRYLRYAEFTELVASIGSVIRHSRAVVQDKLRAGEAASEIAQALSLDDVRACLARFSGSSRILDIEVVELKPGMHAHGPPSQQLSPYDALPLRLDYPFAFRGPAGVREFALRIWSERPAAGAHPTAERVAARVAPAVEQWFSIHAAEIAALLAKTGAAVESKAAATSGIRIRTRSSA